MNFGSRDLQDVKSKLPSINHMKMKKLLHILLVPLTINSCAYQESDTRVDPPKIVGVSDSAISESIHQPAPGKISEPFNISQLEISDRLDFTSGGLPKQDQQKYCENTQKGFFGRYHLIDRKSLFETPLVGTIDIYKPGEMSSWRASDTNQIIWKIFIKSDVISVWDSIRVGISRATVVEFGKTNNGVCDTLREGYYSCEFSNFTVDFRFQNDTVKELTVFRKCDKTINPQKD